MFLKVLELPCTVGVLSELHFRNAMNSTMWRCKSVKTKTGRSVFQSTASYEAAGHLHGQVVARLFIWFKCYDSSAESCVVLKCSCHVPMASVLFSKFCIGWDIFRSLKLGSEANRLPRLPAILAHVCFDILEQKAKYWRTMPATCLHSRAKAGPTEQQSVCYQ